MYRRILVPVLALAALAALTGSAAAKTVKTKPRRVTTWRSATRSPRACNQTSKA